MIIKLYYGRTYFFILNINISKFKPYNSIITADGVYARMWLLLLHTESEVGAEHRGP